MEKAETKYPDQWKEYRSRKMLLITLLGGWFPFGFLVGFVSPMLFGSYIAAYIGGCVYCVVAMAAWLRYVFYSCPKCGTNLRGCQLYSKKCRKCGEIIGNNGLAASGNGLKTD
jgi:predicted RNA-binding Zn-ribbon protein involved in translation (DUF1610 family)